MSETTREKPVRETPQERLVRMARFDNEFWMKGIFPGGTDEAGRGPLVGPLVAACVVMPKEPLLSRINDSKKLTQKRREAVYEEILRTALAFSIQLASVEEIAELNIRCASRLAMERAVEAVNPAYLLVDYERDLNVSCPQEAFTGGDALSYNIAAASILAKVYRDGLMRDLDEKYPGYGFSKNMGYGTREHIQALKKYGPCPAHRALFIRKHVGGDSL